ncbi:MAG: LytTR family DNA-binding domain-containing protein [Clostridiales bacterium]|nr:LytTR family DNA-binding domain-containing protein [Clostridiales bacterium]
MKVIICDDNLIEQERYLVMLKDLAAKHDIVLELATYDSAVSLLFAVEDSKFDADLIFMDINMPNMSGDEASQRLRERGYLNDIVFLTVSKGHFLRAFDVDALHYVVKGETSDLEFERIFLKAVRSLNDKKQKYAAYYGGGETRNIPLNSIRYYEIYRGIVTVYYDKDNSFQFPQMSLQELENELSEYGFFRIHKSYLVALSAIESLTYSEVTLRDGTKLPISRRKYSELRDTLLLKSESSSDAQTKNQSAAPDKGGDGN